MSFTKFPSIESFSSVHHTLKKKGFVIDGKNRSLSRYYGKIKLHGTNAGVHLTLDEDGNAVCSPAKRSGIIPEGQDNAGFAAWLKRPEVHKFFWDIMRRAPLFGEEIENIGPVTIFGEWAGPGVQKGDAVSSIPEKCFFIFAIKQGDKWYVDPADIRDEVIHFNNEALPDQVFVLPWATEGFEVDFLNQENVNIFVGWVNEHVERIGKEDPFIAFEFSKSGPGEGLVFYDACNSHDMEMVFKAKTARHMTNGVTNVKAASVDPIVAEGAAAFAKEFVTGPRIDQAISELFGGDIKNATIKDTGAFLKWVNTDIHKESVATLEKSGLTWESVQKAVSEAAKFEFFKRLNAS